MQVKNYIFKWFKKWNDIRENSDNKKTALIILKCQHKLSKVTIYIRVTR